MQDGQFGEDDTIQTIQSMEELEKIFKEAEEKWKLLYGSYANFGVENYNWEQKKKDLIEDFEINDKFFDKYYIIFIVEYWSNTADKTGVDYITYNRLNNQINLVQQDTRISRSGGCICGYNTYFVKIDKKYDGTVEWKIKYVPF